MSLHVTESTPLLGSIGELGEVEPECHIVQLDLFFSRLTLQILPIKVEKCFLGLAAHLVEVVVDPFLIDFEPVVLLRMGILLLCKGIPPIIVSLFFQEVV